MKIGILTFHTARNYGAFMQCYSLAKELTNELPEHKVEVIDYSSEHLLHDYEKNLKERIFGSKDDLVKSSLVLIMKRLIKTALSINKLNLEKKIENQRKENFDAVKNMIPLSEQALVSDRPEEFEKYITNGEYDVIVVGSDAIWNNNQTSWPNMYLLHDIKNVRKFSYAASTYGMDFSNMTEEQKIYVYDSLKQFDFIGTRDTVTTEYVKSCSNNELDAVHTCDPSVFLDLEDVPIDINDLTKKLCKQGVSFEKPIIGLMCESWLAKKVRKNLGEEYQYVSVYYRTGFEDVFLDNLTPFEWSKVFSLFDFTFTHFFHGTLFSIKNGTRTFSIERGSVYKKKYKTKIKDVLTRLDLLDECYYEDDLMDNDDWDKIIRNVNQNDKKATKEKYMQKLKIESESKKLMIEQLKEVLK